MIPSMFCACCCILDRFRRYVLPAFHCDVCNQIRGYEPYLLPTRMLCCFCGCLCILQLNILAAAFQSSRIARSAELLYFGSWRGRCEQVLRIYDMSDGMLGFLIPAIG